MNSTVMRCPKVSVITLNWNGKNDTIECVTSLERSNYANYDIIVVDNGSTDGSAEVLRSRFPLVTVLENGRNLGYSQGCNAGLQYAYENGAEFFLIINNDAVADRDALGALVRVAQEDRRIGFVSGKTYFYGEPNRLQCVGKLNDPIRLVGELVGCGEIDVGQYDGIKEYDFLDDIFLLVSRSAYEQTKGFDPAFFLYYEEADWCVRVRRAGFKLVYTPDARIWHKHGRSVGGVHSPTFAYHMTRSEIVFIRRNASPGAFARYMWHLAVSTPMRFARLVKHHRLDLLSADVRGMASGLLWAVGRRSERGAVVQR